MDAVRTFVGGFSKDTVLVSGGARGVDSVAEGAARERGLEVEIFPANWKKYGKRAGFLRNEDIVKAADKVYAFWDGQSRGTRHTMELAKKAGKLEAVFTRADG